MIVQLESNGGYWTARWTDAAGNRCRRCVGSKRKMSRTLALAECRNLDVTLRLRPELAVQRGRSPTVGAYLAVWRKRQEGRVGPRTWMVQGSIVDRLEAYLKPATRLDQVTVATAKGWIPHVAEKFGVGGVTQDNHLRIARTVFKEAIEDGVDGMLYGRNPFAFRHQHTRMANRGVPRLSDEIVGRLVEACPDGHWRRLVALCAWGGLRRGEALRLRWQDIDWTGGRLTIWPAGGRETSKQRLRVVRMEALLERTLLEGHESADRVLVCRVNGDPHRRMTSIIMGAGLDPWRDPFHGLRRWRASVWGEQFPKPTVDYWMGHSAEVAARHYFEPTEGAYDRVRPASPAPVAVGASR